MNNLRHSLRFKLALTFAAFGAMVSLLLSLGLSFAAPGEILNQILARHDVRAFGSTMISYTLLLLIGFFVSKGIGALCPKSKARLIYYLLFGFLGLMVEWFLLGNAPVLEPFQIITQPGMFTFWGTMLLGPWLILEPGFAELKISGTEAAPE